MLQIQIITTDIAMQDAIDNAVIKAFDKYLSDVRNLPSISATPLPKYVAMKEAEKITSKSANALRVQISLGNLKSIKKGSRHYFDREYLENWLAGNLNEKGASV